MECGGVGGEEGVEGGESFRLKMGEVGEEEAVFFGGREGRRVEAGVFGEDGQIDLPVGL